METNNSNNRFNDHGDQPPILLQYSRSNLSRKRKLAQPQSIAAKSSPISESPAPVSVVPLAHAFTFDIRILPDSLLLEILARLPVRSIFRFKCVCKHWLALISHPSFCRFYSSRTLSAPPFRIFYRYIYVSKFKELLNRLRPEIYGSSKFSVLFLSSFEEQQQSDQFKVLAMSNGLILCCLLGPLVYYVCDPVTRQGITLPRGRGKSPNRYPIFFGEGIVSRLNQHNMLTSYTVVRVELLEAPSSYLNLEAFSSETGEWVNHRLPCASPIRLLKRGGGPIHFNGALHWFLHDSGMVAFDPYKDPKSCRLIQFPEDRDIDNEYKHDGLYRLCDGCQGKLRFFEVSPDPCGFYCFSMWAMEDYEKGEWVSESKVTRSDLSSGDPELSGWLMRVTFVPLSFHPFDSDVVYLRCVELGCIVAFDVPKRRLEVACKPIGVVEDLSWRVVIPFVLPRWPTPVPVHPNAKKAIKPRPVHHRHAFRLYTRWD